MLFLHLVELTGHYANDISSLFINFFFIAKCSIRRNIIIHVNSRCEVMKAVLELFQGNRARTEHLHYRNQVTVS